MQPVIATEELTRHFGSVRAIEGLSMEVPAGIVFGFLGPNGSGKTTTIRLLLGLLEPTSGTARVLGFDSVRQADAIRARAGALLEHHGLYERLSARDNLEYYGRAYGLPRIERATRIEGLLRQIDLWERRDDPVEGWSRGMKQKLAMARALLHRPRLLFLDEPTAGLDPVASAALRDDLSTLVRREGVTVFLTTHNLVEAERLCETVAVIRQGRLLAIGRPQDMRQEWTADQVEIHGSGFTPEVVQAVRADPAVKDAEVRDGVLWVTLEEGADAAPVTRVLIREGADVRQVHRARASLEDAFLKLMEEDQA